MILVTIAVILAVLWGSLEGVLKFQKEQKDHARLAPASAIAPVNLTYAATTETK